MTEQAPPNSHSSHSSPAGGVRRRGPGARRLLGAALSGLVIAGLAATAAGCASTGTKVVSPGSGGGSADSGASTPASPSPTGGPTLQPGGPPRGTSSSAYPVGHPLNAGSYQASGDKITVYFVAGVCESYGLHADESHSGQVRITVSVTKAPPAGQMCPTLERMQSLAATLHAPLGSRAVVDLSNGKRLPTHPATGSPKVGGKATHGPVAQ
ncbi:hypothetical protein [Phaeacidiphilus oryzae]|uniref:hypothetical protein n=1 Tax=Phaeacidiphilus oryzae TaxID=348818 RepID=UPI0005620DC2|nr:hypothetical protein [Phaeacidiphilus oryzae]